MKQSRLIFSVRCGLFLLSFCIFLWTTQAQDNDQRRFWPWPLRPRPFPVIRPRPWFPYPVPAPAPAPAPVPAIPPTPEMPQPPPKPAPTAPPKPAPGPSPAPGPAPCPTPSGPPTPGPNPSPKPGPPSPPMPGPSPKPGPPTPKPGPPPPKPGPSPPKPGPSPPKPGPSPPKPCPSPPKPGPSPPRPSPPNPGPSPGPPRPRNQTISAVFVFGDSIVDTGMNNNLTTVLKCNFRPYGMDFPFGVATGRFSDGRVPSDFIAEFMGVKKSVPAYFDPRLTRRDLLTGVSFASGGSGYDPITPKLMNVVTMLDQLRYFQRYKRSVRKLVGQEKTDLLVANGLAVVVAGSNDIVNTFYGIGSRWIKDDIHTYTTFMAESAASFAMQLAGFGLKHIGILGTPPLGCVPSQRTIRGGIHRDCDETLNFAAQLFNAKLSIILKQLSQTIPDTKLVYIDIYSTFTQILTSPRDYGFEETRKGCCGTGLLEGGPLCNRLMPVCPNISAYVFWDSFHPTESFYKILTAILVQKYVDILFD